MPAGASSVTARRVARKGPSHGYVRAGGGVRRFRRTSAPPVGRRSRHGTVSTGRQSATPYRPALTLHSSGATLNQRGGMGTHPGLDDSNCLTELACRHCVPPGSTNTTYRYPHSARSLASRGESVRLRPLARLGCRRYGLDAFGHLGSGPGVLPFTSRPLVRAELPAAGSVNESEMTAFSAHPCGHSRFPQ